MPIPRSEDLSPKSPERVLGLAGGTGSESDFSRVEGTSPLCLQVKELALSKTAETTKYQIHVREKV